jgi:ferrous iron transport protein A
MRLSELRVGETGKINQIDLPDHDAQRLMEMGLTIGSTVTLLRYAPMGDPLEVLVRGYHLSLRKQEAHLIGIDLVVSPA